MSVIERGYANNLGRRADCSLRQVESYSCSAFRLAREVGAEI